MAGNDVDVRCRDVSDTHIARNYVCSRSYSRKAKATESPGCMAGATRLPLRLQRAPSAIGGRGAHQCEDAPAMSQRITGELAT